MKRKVKISESQLNSIKHILSEQLSANPTVTLSVNGSGETASSAVTDLSTKIPSGLANQVLNQDGEIAVTDVKNPKNPSEKGTMSFNANDKPGQMSANESYIISKSQIDGIKLKNLKEGSEIISVNKFLK